MHAEKFVQFLAELQGLGLVPEVEVCTIRMFLLRAKVLGFVPFVCLP